MIYPLRQIKTEYLRLNTKTQNIFCRLNDYLTTFLYTLTGATRKQKEKKKVFSYKVYTKVECYKKIGFLYLVLVEAMDRSIEANS